MVAKNFPAALAKVLVHEGGYVNHPADPGGETNRGVTKRVYDAYRKGKGLKARSVRSITTDEVRDIYDRQYWDAVKGDLLPSGVDFVVFDGAVNSGPGQSIKWLQRALQPGYAGKVDGVIGVATLTALKSTNDVNGLIDRICNRRLAFLQALRTWKTFRRGWEARIRGVRVDGKAMATGKAVADKEVVFADGGNAKANIEDAKAAPGKGVADTITGGGIGAGGVAGTVQGLQEQLTPLSAAGDWITTTVAVLAVVGTILTVGGLAYRYYAKRQKAKLLDALDAVPA